eukprot:GFUD01042295.1.p1 GENE.GFUD01042295.1~~GFUD01042295.1.p1  ORF type:complete len:186 (-),score=45.34 GFUD01042295.1:39-596(-)
MCGLTVNTEMQINTQQRKRSPQQDKAKQTSKMMSNDPTKSCKTFCCECDQAVTLSGLRKHVKARHQMSLTEYKELYGNPRMQIINLVYHKCSFCQRSILLDTDDLSKHLKKQHQTSYKDYIVRYMNQQNTVQPTKVGNIVMKKVEPVVEQNEAPLILIRCDECPKTFKQNIQLRAHKKKHLAQAQ